MKVVHMISGDLWAGAEAQAYSLLRELRKGGGIDLSAVLMNEGELAARLRALDIPVRVVNEQHMEPLRILSEVKSFLKSEKVDILHTHRYKENVLGAFASRTIKQIRRVKTVHGLPEQFAGLKSVKGEITGALDTFVTRRYFDRVICVSEDMMKHLARPFGQEKLVCIRNGIDVTACQVRTARGVVRERLGIPADAPVIGSAARLVRVKGLDYLLRATAQLHAALPGVVALIVGDGPEMGRLRTLASELQIAERVIFTGHRDDVYDLIGAMDVFALSSLSEGIPMVLLEAMALGTPIVATRVGGVPEIAGDGITVLLVEPGDPSTLADSCFRMIKDTALAERLRSHARDRVVREHSATTMAQQVLSLYHSLLA